MVVETKQPLLERREVKQTHFFRTENNAHNSGTKSGVNVVLNLLSGKALLGAWRCIAPLGRFIKIGGFNTLASPESSAH